MDDRWTRVDIFTTTEGVEPVSASLLDIGVAGFQVTDGNDLEDFLNRKAGYWDYYDEDLLGLKDGETFVTVYLPQNEQGGEMLAAIKAELPRLKSLDDKGRWGRLEHEVSYVLEEDWAHNWKNYYHAAKIGEGLVICPSWEEYAAKDGEVVVKLDPGMAFGTGTHESTRLCMLLMQEFMQKNARVLDLGCGSGILAISSALLGAVDVLGIDIDEAAVKVSRENADINNVSKKCKFRCDTLGNQINGNFQLVFANLVADIIIEYAHHIISNLSDYGVAVFSGIIDVREDDVRKALTGAGLGVIKRETQGGWVALACQRNKI